MKTSLLVVTTVLLLLLSVTTASALEKQVNITAVTITNESGSLQLKTIRANGVLFSCENNICTAYVSYDCPACPTCPAINYTDLQANLSNYIAASQEKIIKSIIEHNSSPDFKRTDIEAMLADDDEAGKIQDFIQNTVMVKDNDYKNMTIDRDYWKGEWTNLNASYAIETERRLAAEKDNERLSNWMLSLTVGVFLLIGIVVLFVKLDLSTFISNAGARFLKSREGLFPEERELQEVDRTNKALEKKIKMREKLAEKARLEKQLNDIDPEDLEVVAHEVGVLKHTPIIEKKKEVVASEIILPKNIEIDDDLEVKPPPSLSEIKIIVGDFIKSKQGHSYTTRELYKHCREKGITDEKVVSSAALETRNEILNTEGGSWSQKKVVIEGKLTVSHEYQKQPKASDDDGGG